MKYVVDRIEGDYIIVEIGVGKTTQLPKILIPNAQEGDVIKIEIDDSETKNRKEKIEDLMNQIFEDK